MDTAPWDLQLRAIEAKLAAAAPRFGGKLRGAPAEAIVPAFERAHGVVLPDTFRALLLRLGDGPPGLLPLAQGVEDAALSSPSVLDPAKTYDDYDDEPTQGTLALTAGSPRAVLVVSGAQRGQVFYLDLDSFATALVEHAHGKPASVLDWYDAWLDVSRPGARGSVATVLGEGLLGDEAALVDAYRQGTTDERRRRKAIVALAHRDALGPEALRIVEMATRDADAQVRKEALLALAAHDEGGAYGRAEALALRDPDPLVRRAAVRWFAQSRASGWWTVLDRALEDDDVEVVFSAVRQLLEHPATDLQALASRSRVRAAPNAYGLALHGMIERGDARFIPDLRVALDDPRPPIRRIAVMGLGKVGDDRLCAELCARLAHESDPQVRTALEPTIAKLCGPSAAGGDCSRKDESRT